MASEEDPLAIPHRAHRRSMARIWYLVAVGEDAEIRIVVAAGTVVVRCCKHGSGEPRTNGTQKKETGHQPCSISSRRILGGSRSSGRPVQPALAVRFWSSCQRCLSHRPLGRRVACDGSRKQQVSDPSCRHNRDMRPVVIVAQPSQSLARGQYESDLVLPGREHLHGRIEWWVLTT